MRLRYYPFLVDLGDFSASRLGFRVTLRHLASDPSIAELAIDEIYATVSGEEPRRRPSTTEEAVFTFYLALALAKAVGPSLVESLARRYASLASSALTYEDEDSIISIASSAGVRVARSQVSIPWSVGRDGRVRVRVIPYAIPLPDYLTSISDSGMPELELVNQMLSNGKVYVDKNRLVKILGTAFYKRIMERAAELDPEEIENPELVERAREAYERGLRRRRGIAWDRSALPPCIAESLSAIARGAASEGQLYLAATFIGAVGATASELSTTLGLPPDSSRVRGLLNLARLAAERGFTVYTCGEAAKKGLCPSRDSCRAPDPYREYLRRLSLRSRGTRRRGQT